MKEAMFILGMIFASSMQATLDVIGLEPFIEFASPVWVYAIICLLSFTLAIIFNISRGEQA